MGQYPGTVLRSIFQKDFRLVLELSMGQELAMH